MICPGCRQDNPSDARFCVGCGARLALACGACGAELPAGARFCLRCGETVAAGTVAALRSPAPETYTPRHLAEKILTSKAALEGERKHVTVLFADLKGSMELLADRDPEEARRLLDPVLERMMEAVHLYEGTVNQVMGDGIMALFGAPLAHEDHAVRACYAALRMQELVKRYAEDARRTQGVNVQIRVGLNSGEVVVRAIGSDLHMDYTAVGQTTHLAARMEQLASPGSILLPASTLELVKGYVAVTALGPIPVKGLAAAVEVYEVTGAGPARTRLQASAWRGLTRFVGRGAELEALRRAQQLAGSGHGQVVAAVGEAGVGKSRLIYEFIHSHRLKDWLVLEATSLSYGRGASYLAVADLLKRYFQIEARDDKRRIREKVTGKLLSLDLALDLSLPALLALLDVPDEGEQWMRLEAAERRRWTLDSVRRLLLRQSQLQPLLVVFEDLHWADSETQALLADLVEKLPGARILVLLSYRPEYTHGWGGKTYYSQVRVDPLASTNVEELLHALFGGDAALEGLKRLLIDRTDGNPFFLEESVRTLVETKALVGELGGYQLTAPIQAIQVPASVQAVLASRIDRLPSDEKRLLQAAAVIGTSVPFALLQAIVELPETELHRCLAHLQSAELLHETSLFPDLEYTFRHALTHEVTYGSLLQERRRELHAGVVAAIERLHRDRRAEHVEVLAYHALRGGLWDRAVTYLREGSIRAAGRSAYREALTSFEEALRVLARLPVSREATAQAIDLRLDSRAVLAPLGQYGRILDYMREAEALARELGDRRRLGLVLADIGARLRNVGDHERAIDASRQALDIATELEDAGLQIEAKYRLAQAHFAIGDLSKATVLFMETVHSLADESVVRRAALPAFFSAWPRAWLGLAFSHLGRFAEALDYAEGAIRIAEGADHPHTLVEAHGALGGVSLERGDLQSALRVFEQGVGLLRRRGFGDANVLSGLGYAYSLAGRLTEGLPLLEEAVQIGDSISAMGLGHAVRINRLAEAYAMAGRPDEALDRAHHAIDLSRKHKERANEALGLRALAEIMTRVELLDTKAIAEHYATSLSLAKELGMRPLVAHCHLGLGNLYSRTGRRQESRECFRIAAGMYLEMGMQFWLDRAEAGMSRPA